MARDPRQAVRAVRVHVQRAKKSSGRLLMAGLGFSVAYFFDPARGRARRKRVVDLIRPALRSHLGARVAPDAPARVERAAPDLPRIGLADHGPRPTFLRATDGIRASARV